MSLTLTGIIHRELFQSLAVAIFALPVKLKKAIADSFGVAVYFVLPVLLRVAGG